MWMMFTAAALATTPRWAYEAAYDNVSGGDWYQDYDNESADLAWGQSYVMMSLATMFEATSDPIYLDRLGEHIEGVLAQRDDARGVSDYRGVSGACWRDVYYTPEPYCYVVHSGMIAFPIAEFAALVREHDLGRHPATDGESFGDKAERYATAAAETVAHHDDQWRDDGTYVFREDADFIGYPGVDVPYNQANAMGRVLLALYRATDDTAYLDKATGLAQAFQAGISSGPSGEYLWNYWGGSYEAPGEDISHAFINVAFAAEAAKLGVVFDEADMWAFSETFVSNVYVDDQTVATYVGGGSTNYGSYPWIVALWLDLAPWRTTVYAVARNKYDADIDPETLGSGWQLLGWAQLAEQQPPLCAHFFYSVDWEDQGDWQQATAYSGNILTVPPDYERGCLVPLQVDVSRDVTVGQWDGTVYHPVARWQETGGETERFVAYEPAWPYIYWEGGALFQFADDFVSGEGIRVGEPEALTAPTITSEPPDCTPGETLSHAPTGSGDSPWWWSLPDGPPGARVDAATGVLTWEAGDPCDGDFRLVLTNDVGEAELSWSFEGASDTGGGDSGDPGSEDSGDPGDGGGDGGDDSGDDGGVGGGDDGDVEATPAPDGCGCASGPTGTGVLWGLISVLLVGFRRRDAHVVGSPRPPADEAEHAVFIDVAQPLLRGNSWRF